MYFSCDVKWSMALIVMVEFQVLDQRGLYYSLAFGNLPGFIIQIYSVTEATL